MKYSKKIVKRITDLIRADSFTIAEICAKVNISERCYYEWQKENAEFAEAIKSAKDCFDEMLLAEAKKSIVKKVKGYDVEEVKTLYVDSGKVGAAGASVPKIKEQTKTTKHIQPDTASIIFVLTNKAPEEWKNRINSEITGKEGKDLIPQQIDISVLSEEERKVLLKVGENALNAQNN
ncbi:MAG: hypothetical protein LLF93_03145 [Bacteroidales bacterium]|nr:hypothetical protein [Bacteroidales bacterium]